MKVRKPRVYAPAHFSSDFHYEHYFKRLLLHTEELRAFLTFFTNTAPPTPPHHTPTSAYQPRPAPDKFIK